MSAPRWIALSFCLLLSSAAPLRAEVVFGNLGDDGSGSLSDTGTNFGGAASTQAIAVGFTTGSDSDFLQLQSVTLGLFATSSGTLQRSVSIFSDASGNPGSSLVTSGTVNVGDDAKYTFPFSNYQLAAGTSYWIVPEGSATWYRAEPEVSPSGRNESGWSFVAGRSSTVGSAGPWSSAATTFSVSVQAVPEPSTVALALVGVGGLIGVRLRRRMARLG